MVRSGILVVQSLARRTQIKVYHWKRLTKMSGKPPYVLQQKNMWSRLTSRLHKLMGWDEPSIVGTMTDTNQPFNMAYWLIYDSSYCNTLYYLEEMGTHETLILSAYWSLTLKNRTTFASWRRWSEILVILWVSLMFTAHELRHTDYSVTSAPIDESCVLDNC